jgi:hypothetical protein
LPGVTTLAITPAQSPITRTQKSCTAPSSVLPRQPTPEDGHSFTRALPPGRALERVLSSRLALEARTRAAADRP